MVKKKIKKSKIDSKSEKTIIGRLERVSLPGFGIKKVEAKIDTGAYNGAIHVSSIEEKVKDGEDVLTFKLLDEEHPEYNGKTFVAREFKKKMVKNSIGGSEARYLIPVTLVLKRKKFDVQLGLSNRGDMRYPILIGRKIIKKHFIVDAARKFTGKKSASAKATARRRK